MRVSRSAVCSGLGLAMLEITIRVTPDGKEASYTATTRRGQASSDIDQTQTVTFHLSD